MRTLRLGRPLTRSLEHRLEWIEASLREIERASHGERAIILADNMTISNLTVSRTLDCDAATVAELCDIVGTLMQDMQNRAVKRT